MFGSLSYGTTSLGGIITSSTLSIQTYNIMKSLTYCLRSMIVRPLRYTVISQHIIDLNCRYALSSQHKIRKSIRVVISVQKDEIDKIKLRGNIDSSSTDNINVRS